ncbi:MAG TPA: hypothetical protein VGK19_06385 [Capsulimonadaceae bacterium]|jgi:hypothetical protein
MLLFIGGYVLVAVAFYSYIALTAQEEPQAAEWANAPGKPAHAMTYVGRDNSGNATRRAA